MGNLKLRLFTFGCSFTSYKWPTWADIAGYEFLEFHNYGMCGGGNLFIFNSLVEAIARHQINKDDTVMIMWTNVLRDDRYTTEGWLGTGNLHTSRDYFSKEFIDKFITIRGCYVRDIPLIHSAYLLLKNLGCSFHFMSMVDIDNNDQYSYNKSKNVDDILSLYAESLSIVKPSIHREIFKFNWNSRFKKNDPHPHPIDYLLYLYKVVPEIKVSRENVKRIIELDKELKANGSIEWNPVKIKRL